MWARRLLIGKAGTALPGGALNPPDAFDLSAGETPPPRIRQSVDTLIADSASRRRHRIAAAFLVFIVVGSLVTGMLRLVSRLSKDLQHIEPAAVGLVASLVVAISVLTLALVKYTFSAGGKSDDSDAIAPPSIEGFKVAGEMVSKLGELLKSVKP